MDKRPPFAPGLLGKGSFPARLAIVISSTLHSQWVQDAQAVKGPDATTPSHIIFHCDLPDSRE